MAVILDACGVLNLYASGRFLTILAASGDSWHLPAAVERESQTYRQPAPADPTRLVAVPIDLAAAIECGLIRRCDCETEAETKLYVELTARLRDDGESMGLALAKCRGWSILTDDKKARRIVLELGVPTLGTPQVVKGWADATQPDSAELAETLRSIEVYANYLPGRTAPELSWWLASREWKAQG